MNSQKMRKRTLQCLGGWLLYCKSKNHEIYKYDPEHIIRLLVITVVVAVSAEFLVSAIESVVAQWHISETFIGNLNSCDLLLRILLIVV